MEKSGRLYKRNRLYFKKQGIQGLTSTYEETDVPRIEMKEKNRH